jgi:hypothetical protein
VAVALVDARPVHGKSLNQAIQTVLQSIRLIANLQSLGLGAGGRHRKLTEAHIGDRQRSRAKLILQEHRGGRKKHVRYFVRLLFA